MPNKNASVNKHGEMHIAMKNMNDYASIATCIKKNCVNDPRHIVLNIQNKYKIPAKSLGLCIQVDQLHECNDGARRIQTKTVSQAIQITKNAEPARQGH